MILEEPIKGVPLVKTILLENGLNVKRVTLCYKLRGQFSHNFCR